uniref:Abi family protein n=1 Tax=uncultured Elusimicrobia bacterium TaxID=699876 RepID=A0A650ELG6_9BACT|nr:hypothetical protein Elusimicrob1349_1270 [uncultured Elusimicrobia bacterium]
MHDSLKEPTSFQKQIDILTERGLDISDEAYAISVLEHKNYYRLRAYSIEFEEQKDKFFKGTTFEQIEQLYNFDRLLRALCMQATATIEISLRTQFAYQSSHATNSPIPHENDSLFGGLFKGFESYAEFKKNKIHGMLLSSTERFILHHRYNYPNFPIIPIWAVVEVITFSTLVSLYNHINKSIQNRIRNTYKVPSVGILGNWLHLCCVVRNTCAHHSALWLKSFPNIILPKNKKANKRASLWEIVLVLYSLLGHISIKEAAAFKEHIITLIDETNTKLPCINLLAKMGFPNDWKEKFIPYC